MRKARKTSSHTEARPFIYQVFVVVRSSVIAVVISLICFIIFALIMKLANLQETIIQPVIEVIRILSIAAGGALAARVSRRRGWIKGSATGLLYIIWAYAISLLFGGGFELNTLFLSDVILGLIVGAVGGIIGVNLD